MRIIIAGGSGFLGSALTAQLAADGHHTVILTRHPASAPPPHPHTTYETWSPNGQTGPWAKTLDGADAVINLSGESIAGKRWSDAQKQKIRESRLLATRSLTAAIRNATKTPRAFISGSAVGYYGDRGDETLTESSTPGDDFLAGVCKDWEAAASTVGDLTRVVLVRTGHRPRSPRRRLAKNAAAVLSFAGGPIGSGRQYMPWIHKSRLGYDLVSWAATSDAVRGAVNATGPMPVTNKEFSTALGHALRRPSVMPAPAFALRLALGEMADALLLSGQRAFPLAPLIPVSRSVSQTSMRRSPTSLG